MVAASATGTTLGTAAGATSDGRTPLVEFENATVRRGGRDILSVEHLRIDRGERIAILGPNGAGKSTLVNVVTRQVLPLYAEPAPVRWLGRDRLETAELRRLCGVVSSREQWTLDVHLSVGEVVTAAIYGTLAIPPSTEVDDTDRAAAERAIDAVGLAGFEARDLTSLSTGEARRAAIARALVHEPQVLILDEPTAGLDPTAAYDLRRTVRDLAQRGVTLVLVTHHLEDIIPEVDRVVLVAGGRVVADGPKGELLTSSVISDLYNIPVTVQERGGEYRLWEG